MVLVDLLEGRRFEGRDIGKVLENRGWVSKKFYGRPCSLYWRDGKRDEIILNAEEQYSLKDLFAKLAPCFDDRVQTSVFLGGLRRALLTYLGEL